MIPILYESENISLQTLWVFVVIGLLVASHLTVKRLKRKRVNFTLFIKHSTTFLFAALVVSRFVFFFTNKDAYFPAFDFRTLWNFIAIWDQGFSFWGGSIGFFGMLAYMAKKEEEDLWKWFDALSVPVIVGMIIGYFGAFLGGYAYGIPTDLPWGIQYEAFNVKYTVPVHPTQLYAVIALSTILLSKFKLKKKHDFFETDGNSTLYLTSLGSFAYFLISFLRGDEEILISSFRLSSIISLAVFIISAILIYPRIKNQHESI